VRSGLLISFRAFVVDALPAYQGWRINSWMRVA
jgi:hypothetical protein